MDSVELLLIWLLLPIRQRLIPRFVLLVLIVRLQDHFITIIYLSYTTKQIDKDI